MDYPTAVKTLAVWHHETEDPPQRIYCFRDPAGQVVRLVEVTDLVPETGEFYPIEFGPTREMPYRTILAQVTPDEWTRITRREMALPEGWDLTACEGAWPRTLD